MGRLKKFNRDDVLARAMPVFWKNGFAKTSLQELEEATRVNKSGLYAEFEDKEDLFLAALRHYLGVRNSKGILATEPLGWHNVEKFLNVPLVCIDGQKGCFAVNSMREFAVLPPEALEIVKESRTNLARLLTANIEAEGTSMDATAIAEVVLAFFSGLCLEQNFDPPVKATKRKIENMMLIIRAL